MKQAENKLFRGCPYRNMNFETCAKCPNYQRCLEKKKARKSARRVEKVQWFINIMLPIIIAIVTMITAIVAIIMCASVQNSLDRKEDATIPTIATTTEPSYVVVNLGAQNTTVASTEENSIAKHVIMEEETMVEEVVQEAKISAKGPSESFYYSLSEEDMLLIAKLVWAEARGECFEGKVAVAAVVLNRYYWGNNRDFNRESIETVITQRNQFANIKKVSKNDLQEVPECMEAVEAACKGWDPTRSVFEEGALYFYAPKGVSGYQKEIRDGIEVMTIGNHNFHANFEKVR